MVRTLGLAILLAGGVAFHGLAQALNKCVGAGGKVTYSEVSCPAGAKSVSIQRGSASGSGSGSAAAGGGSADVDRSFYDVTGTTYESVLAGLKAGSAGSHFARADWRVSYEIRWSTGAGGCKVSEVRTKLQLSVRAPRWTAPPGAAPELSSRWGRFMAALNAHEDGHLEHGRRAEREARSVLAGLSAADCGALDAMARERFQRIIDDYSARDREYDRSTDHGRTQGAVF